MRMLTAAMLIGGMLVTQVQAQTPAPAEKPAAPAEATVAKGAAAVVKVRGTVAAVDKDNGTVKLKGPKGRTVTIEVRDRAKLDEIKVGDPVLATYTEAVVLQLKKAGTATPGMSVQETRATSKPGETPAGAIGREIQVTGTITAIDQKGHTVTVKGPEGNSETIKVKDPKNLKVAKVGDMVELTYIQALAIALDKPAAKAK